MPRGKAQAVPNHPVLPPRWLTIREASARARMSDDCLRRLLETGRLTAHRPTERKVLIDLHELDNLIVSSVARRRRRRPAQPTNETAA